MSALSRITVRVPECVARWFRELEYGEKQLAGTGALLCYFHADRESQRVYRSWARDIFEGYGTLEKPAQALNPPTYRKPAKRRPGRRKRRTDR